MVDAGVSSRVRANLRALRDPRYAPLAALMVLVALVCIGAGSWQIARFEGKVHDNDVLRANAHDPAVPVATLLPLVGAPAPSADSIRYRTVRATGRYDGAHTAYVRLRSVAGKDGSLVLTPFVTRDGVLLVVRGLRPSAAATNRPLSPPPSGQVTITARAQASEANRDSTTDIARGQLLSINAPAQAKALGDKVFDGYAELLPGQPGSRGAQLVDIPPPNLSNPAGGAVEPQHFAYIIQWYLFALLALAAPFAMIRADRKERESAEPAPHHAEPAAPVSDEQRRAAKLADRYGRAAPR